MSANKQLLNQAMSQSNQANSELNNINQDAFISASDKYNQLAGQNTGANGYNQSLKLATQGANVTAANAGNQAKNSYRSAGLTKAQAAQLAGGQAAQSYNDNINNQQTQASNQLNNQLSAAGTSANLANQQYSNDLTKNSARQNLANSTFSNYLNKRSSDLGIASSAINSAANVAGTIASVAASDERIKNYSCLNSAKDCSAKIGQILDSHKHPDFQSLKITVVKK